MTTINTSPRVQELEREWYQARVPSSTSGTPLNTLKMTYWKSIATNTVPAAVKTLTEAERVWLKNVIVANGGTPGVNATIHQLWKELADSAGLGHFYSWQDAKRVYFLNVTTSP